MEDIQAGRSNVNRWNIGVAGPTVPLEADWQITVSCDSNVILPPRTLIVDCGMVSSAGIVAELRRTDDPKPISTWPLAKDQWTRFCPGLLSSSGDTFYFTFWPRLPDDTVSLHVRIG